MGDAVLYRDPFIDNVFHRIVDLDSTKYVLKGDNNDWLDSHRPTIDDIKGILWIHIPKIGQYVNKLRTPVGIAVTVLILSIIVLSSAGIIHFSSNIDETENVNIIEEKIMFEQTQNTSILNRFSSKHISIICFVGIMFLIAVFITIIGFSKEIEFTPNEEVNFSHLGEFSYTGAAEPTLFDSDQLQPGDPIFQNMNDYFDVIYDYQFYAQNFENVTGTYSLSTVIGAGNGWHRTFNIITDEPFNTPELTVTGTVDLIEIRDLIEKMVTDTGYKDSSYWLNVEILIFIEGTINDIPITEIHSSELKLSYTPIQLTLAQSISDLSTSEPQSLLKRVSKRSEVKIPFIGLVVDTYLLRVIGIGSLSIITSILIYLISIWMNATSKLQPVKTDLVDNEALSTQNFINELGFESSFPQKEVVKVKEEEISTLELEKSDSIETFSTDEDKLIEQLFEKESIQSAIEEEAATTPATKLPAPARRRKMKKSPEKLTTDQLNTFISNKNMIIVESLNLKDYKTINISNYKQLLVIADQENNPIYYIAEDNSYKFIVTLPQTKVCYTYTTEGI